MERKLQAQSSKLSVLGTFRELESSKIIFLNLL